MSKPASKTETPTAAATPAADNAQPPAPEGPPSFREPPSWQPAELLEARRDEELDRLRLIVDTASDLMQSELQKHGPLSGLSEKDRGDIRRACVEEAHNLILDCIAMLGADDEDDGE